MTESEWLNATDPQPMLESLRGKVSDRKLRLFAVACCCRLPLHWHDAQELRNAIALAERMAEGAVTREEWRVTHDRFIGRTLTNVTAAILGALAPDIHAAVFGATNDAAEAAGYEVQMRANERAAQVGLIHEVFVNPFRPVTTDPSVLAWSDRPVVRLAQAIYQEKRWTDMPILGDALLDAGCDNEDMLSHCRQQKEHLRGCWVIDLLLNKS